MDSTSPSGGDQWEPVPGTRQAAVLETVRQRTMVRLSELAAEFGVQPVTIRRDVTALANAGLVRRVHGGVTAAARSAASDAASGLGGHVRIGALVPSLEFYWPDVMRGAEEEAHRLGLRMVLRGSVYHATDERDDIKQLIASDVSGLLLAPTVVGAGGELIREWLAEAPVPVVLMERTANVGPMHRSVESVVTDHARGAAMAVHYLASLGHRRIGVALNAQSPHVEQIRTGWESACAELELDMGVTDVAIPERREAGYDRTMASIVEMAQETGTTGLIVHSDAEAVRVVQSAQERGLTIPGDLSVISYDDQVATLATPSLSAVRPPRRTIGRAATSLLAARLADPGRAPHRVQVSPQLTVRESSGPPAAA